MNGPIRPDRRRVLCRMAALAGSAVLLELPALTGCAPGSKEPPGTVRVPLASLTPGRKSIVPMGTSAVELTRTADGVQARSLLCTHWGCTVRWDEASNRYKCPCHHGEYDADGNVVLGPPPRPLATLPVEIAGDTVIVRPAVVKR
jgi:cytochrome b6-f complex iron-sulfur subunit